MNEYIYTYVPSIDMAPKTRRSCKKAAPAAASLKAVTKSATGVQKGGTQKTTVDKSADCQTLRQVVRFGLSTLGDEPTERVREALYQQHPEMKDKVRKRSKKKKNQDPAKKTSKRGDYKPRTLKPPDLVTDTRVEQLKTLLRLLFGDELIMPILDQKLPSRNAGDLMMALILTKYWGLPRPLPASKIAEFFGQGGRNQRYIPSVRFNEINDALELPYPPRRQEYLGRPTDDKVNDQQDQKAPGVHFATPAKLPKTEVLSEMKEEPETEVKVEQQMDVPCGHQHQQMTDDEYDEEQVKPMLMQSDNTEEFDKHVKTEIKEEGEKQEVFGCCFPVSDEDAAASVKSESYCCHNYNDFVAALQREKQRFIAWQSQQCFKMTKSDLIPAAVLPNLCNVKDDEPMDEVDEDEYEYDDFSSGYTKEAHPLQTLLLESFYSNEYTNIDKPLDVAEFYFDDCCSY